MICNLLDQIVSWRTNIRYILLLW